MVSSPHPDISKMVPFLRPPPGILDWPCGTDLKSPMESSAEVIEESGSGTMFFKCQRKSVHLKLYFQ